MSLQQRIITKNEATGMRLVNQYVQEFWECGWQPFDSRNDRGIDGLIIMRKKHIDLGVKVNVQVKCGAKYISSTNKKEIRIVIDDEAGLNKHLECWRNQLEPAVLVFVNPSILQLDANGNAMLDGSGKKIWKESRLTAQAWWVNLKDPGIQPGVTRTVISIPRNQRFGEHSKGDFLKLIRPLLSTDHLSMILPNAESRSLLYSDKLKEDARKFFKDWKNNNKIYCKAADSNIIVSKKAWRHIVAMRRGKERRINSWELLGIAKQMIEEVSESYLLQQIESKFNIEQKYGLRARFEDKNQGQKIVQVILLMRRTKPGNKITWWFYSVHYRR